MTEPIPMFCRRDELLEGLRLSGASGQAVIALVNDGIVDASIRLTQGLGMPLIQQLRSIPPAVTPSTTDQVRRAAAGIAERLMVRVYLLTVDSALTRDGSAGYLQAWNREGFMRAPSASEREGHIRSMERQIERNLQIASTTSLSSASPRMRALSIGPESRQYPFDSIGW